MVGFATSFHILRGETYPEYFGDPLSSFMTTFAMMIGELNYVDLVTNVSFFIFLTKYLGVTFNFGKQDVIDSLKISKLTICRASKADS